MGVSDLLGSNAPFEAIIALLRKRVIGNGLPLDPQVCLGMRPASYKNPL